MTTSRRAGTGRPGMGAKKPVQTRTAIRKTPGIPKRARIDAQGVSAASAGAVLDAMAETPFQREVKESLEKRGYVVWHVPDSRRMRRGMPDLIFFHPLRPRRLYCWELKTEEGKLRPEQAIALACLGTVPGVDARVVRPADWRRLSEEV